MARTSDAHAMDKYLDKANMVLESFQGFPIPKLILQGCAGLILIKATEVGLVISGTSGSGLLLSNRGPKWSAPVAVNLKAVGIGAVLGGADKDIVIALNRWAMDKFLDGRFELKLGEDIGFAAGIGISGGSDVGVTAENFGWATSLVYTVSEGALISVEVTGTGIAVDDRHNMTFYGTNNVKDILEGKAKVPDGATMVTALQEKLKAWASNDEVDRGALG